MARLMPIQQQELQTAHFVMKWRRGLEKMSLDDLYEGTLDGKRVIPNVDIRQSKLIELTVNAGIETLLHIYLSVERDHPNLKKEPLSLLIHDDPEQHAQRIIEDFFNDPYKIEDCISQLRKQHLIRTANDLIAGKGSDEQKRQRVITKLQQYDDAVAAFRAKRDANEDANIRHDDGQEKRISKPSLKLPVEPRVKAFNEIAIDMDEALQLLDSGQKNRKGAEKKLYDQLQEDTVIQQRQKGAVPEKPDPLKIKDINRIGVILKFPEHGEIFSGYLQQKFKNLSINKPTAYDEGWQVTKTGMLDRKILVAFPTTLFTTKTVRSDQVLGSLGEVKIMSTEMREADELSHRVYDACRRIAGRGKTSLDPKPMVEEYRDTPEEQRGKTRLHHIITTCSTVEHHYMDKTAEYRFSMDRFPKAQKKHPFTARRLAAMKRAENENPTRLANLQSRLPEELTRQERRELAELIEWHQIHTAEAKADKNPDVPITVATADHINDVREIHDLYNNLVHFNQHLCITRAHQHRNRDWVKLYAETAYAKIAEMERTRADLERERKGPNPTPGIPQRTKELGHKIKAFIPIEDLQWLTQDLPENERPTLDAARRKLKDHIGADKKARAT